MDSSVHAAIDLARALQEEVPLRYVPPSAGTRPRSEMVLPHSHVRGTRGYIERVAYQINGCYEYGWYDACGVMMRRLMETLIIEAFEHHGRAAAVQKSNGDFYYLADLITAALKESAWNLGRKTRAALPRLKDLGDQSAHSRRFVAHREDVDKVQADFRVVVQEFVFLAALR